MDHFIYLFLMDQYSSNTERTTYGHHACGTHIYTDKAIFIVVVGIFIEQMEQALSKMYHAYTICKMKIPIAILKNDKCNDS